MTCHRDWFLSTSYLCCSNPVFPLSTKSHGLTSGLDYVFYVRADADNSALVLPLATHSQAILVAAVSAGVS